MDKVDIILNLVRQGKITNEEAKVLLSDQVKQDLQWPWTTQPIYPYSPTPSNPYYLQPFVVTCQA